MTFFLYHSKDNTQVIHFHIKSKCARPRFQANNVWKVYHKCLFWKQRSWHKNYHCQFVAFIGIKRLCMFPHFCDTSFSVKALFYEINKTISCVWKFNKNKFLFTLTTFCNFTYFSSYLQTKTFIWKRHYLT